MLLRPQLGLRLCRARRQVIEEEPGVVAGLEVVQRFVVRLQPAHDAGRLVVVEEVE